MNKNIKKILIIFIVFLYCFFPLKTFSEIKTDVDHLIIQDFHSGKILFERDADDKIYPASMTKIMTAIVAFDLL